MPTLSDEPVVVAEFTATQCHKSWKCLEETFVREVFPQLFVPTLHKNGVLTDDDLGNMPICFAQLDEDLWNRDHCYQKSAEWLFDTLASKLKVNPSLMPKVLDSLVQDDWYLEIAQQLERHLLENQQDVVDLKSPTSTNSPLMRLVNVPGKVAFFIERITLRKVVWERLCQMSRNAQESWLVLHGMGGSGKTVLAAGCVREFLLSEELLYRDGVFWINIGRSENPTIDQQTLCTKIDFLYEQIKILYPNSLPSVEDLNKKRLHIEHHFKTYPRSLIVLDGVWSQKELRMFRFNVPVLVTSRDERVVPKDFPEVKCIKIDNQDGDNVLDYNDSIRLLINCLKLQEIKVNENELRNNQDLKQILDRINHLPYIIPRVAEVIGPSMFTDLDCWKELADHLHEYDDIEESCNYLIEQSIAMLSEKEKEILFHFGLFFSPISIEVLQTVTRNQTKIWKMKLNQILDQLCKKSLLIQNKIKQKSQQYFTIHDLTRDYIQKQFTDKKERHTKLINAYLDLYCSCNGVAEYHQLPNDSYIYQNILSHFVEADLNELFQKMFLDFLFIERNIRYVGISGVLSAFQLIEQRCSKVDHDRLEDYRRFIRSNSDICAINGDLKQLALCEVSTSSVYDDAHSLLIDDDHFYFEWTNKLNCWADFQQKELNYKPGCKVRCAAYLSKFGLIVTACGSTLTFWATDTTENLISQQMSTRINHFVISEDGKHLLICYDNDVATLSKLELERLKFAESSRRRSLNAVVHSGRELSPTNDKWKTDSCSISEPQFLCGAISVNSQFLMLGTDTGHLFLYSVGDGQKLGSIVPHDIRSNVECCCFSPGSEFILCLVDLVIYVYSVETKPFSLFPFAKWKSDLKIHNALFHRDSNHRQFVFASSDKKVIEYELFKDVDKNNNTSRFEYDSKNSHDKFRYFSLCAVAPSGHLVAGYDNTESEIILWRRHSSQPYKFFTFPESIISLSFSDDSKKLFACNDTSELAIWNVEEEKEYSMPNQIIANRKACFFYNEPDLFNTVTIGADYRLRLYSGFEGEEVPTKLTARYASCDIAGDYILAVTRDSKVYLYNHSTSRVLFTDFNTCDMPVLSCKILTHKPEELQMAIILPSGIRYLDFDLKSETFTLTAQITLEMIGEHLEGERKISGVHLIPNTPWVLLIFDDDSCLLYNQSGGTVRWKYSQRPISFHYNHTGNELNIVLSFANKKVLLVTILNGETLATRADFQLGQITRVVRVGSTRLLCGTDDGKIIKLSYKHEPKISGPTLVHSTTCQVGDLAFSSDERFIISACDSIKLWSADEGSLLRTFFLNRPVKQMFVHFSNPELHEQQNGANGQIDTNNNNNPQEPFPDITVAAITDKKLFILRKLTHYKVNAF